jgi:hypothetical protein
MTRLRATLAFVGILALAWGEMSAWRLTSPTIGRPMLADTSDL